MPLRGLSLMLCALLLPHLSFHTLVMAPFFSLKLWCRVFSVRLDIVVVVLVCELRLSALSHLCLNQMHQLRHKGKEKKLHLTWVKITFNTPLKMFFKVFYAALTESKTPDFLGDFFWFFRELLQPTFQFFRICQLLILQERACFVCVCWLADPWENRQVNISHRACVCVCPRASEHISKEEFICFFLCMLHTCNCSCVRPPAYTHTDS